MILGIGNDLVDIRRIEKSLARFGARFENRVFDDREQLTGARRAAHLAKRFAAKEACAKALGTGLSAGVQWRDMVVVKDATGRPSLELSGGALKRLQALTPAGMQAQLHLTLADEYPLAQAVVVLSAIPDDLAVSHA